MAATNPSVFSSPPHPSAAASTPSKKLAVLQQQQLPLALPPKAHLFQVVEMVVAAAARGACAQQNLRVVEKVVGGALEFVGRMLAG